MNFKCVIPALSILMLWSFTVGCKTNNEISSEQQRVEETHKGMEIFSAKNTEYRGFPAKVPFFDPAKEGNDPQIAIQKRKMFIKASGLPSEESVVEFKKNSTFNDIFFLYKKYLNDNASSPYAQTFRQYGAWLILTRLDLLASSSHGDLDITYALLNELVQSNYKGFQLLSYGAQHLYENDFQKEKIKGFVQTFLIMQQ